MAAGADLLFTWTAAFFPFSSVVAGGVGVGVVEVEVGVAAVVTLIPGSPRLALPLLIGLRAVVVAVAVVGVATGFSSFSLCTKVDGKRK